MAAGSIVIDSSALYELVLPGDRFPDVETAIGGRRLNAPDIVGLEVLSALRRQVRLGNITAERADGTVARLRSAPIRYWRTHPFVPRIWQLRHNISSYDAAYVALAEILACSLMTVDQRLREVPGLTVDVIP